MTQKDKKSFVLYQNFENQFQLLSMQERGELISAIFEYARAQTISVKLTPLAQMAFSCMKDTLDRDREAYLAKCEQNAKNARSGKKQSSPENSDRERSHATASDNDNENDIDNENHIDIDIDNERSEAPQKRAYARAEKKRNDQKKKLPDRSFSNSSFDTDDFFQAALERSRHWDGTS